MLHVKGDHHVGKARFLQEIAYHFYQRSMFFFLIMYQDLSKVETHPQFKALMDNLNTYLSAAEAEQENIMDIDNQDEESVYDDENFFNIDRY